jgi:hypothetical protein
MSKYAYGTLYLVRPDSDPDDDEAVVDSFDRMRSAFEVAKELWEIAGHPERAQQIKQAISDGYDPDGALIKTSTIDELLRLTEGLEQAVIAGVPLDSEGRVSSDKLEELRRTTKRLWLSESRGETAVYGVREGVHAVDALRKVLTQAKEQGLYIAFD